MLRYRRYERLAKADFRIGAYFYLGDVVSVYLGEVSVLVYVGDEIAAYDFDS